MDYRLLEYFLRISELGSINRAATDLHLSQSALSRHIASLEHDLGASLFNRHHGGVTLTEAGSLLADRARPILRQLTILKEQIGDKAAGQLAVGVPASWHHIFTADYVSRIINECPGVKLRVFEGASNALSEQMSAGLLDLAIVPFKSESSLGYNQTKLLREPAVLVGPAAARLDADVGDFENHGEGSCGLMFGARGLSPLIADARRPDASAQAGAWAEGGWSALWIPACAGMTAAHTRPKYSRRWKSSGSAACSKRCNSLRLTCTR